MTSSLSFPSHVGKHPVRPRRISLRILAPHLQNLPEFLYLLEAAAIDGVLEEAIDQNTPTPYGAILWPSAQALLVPVLNWIAQRQQEQTESMQPIRVVEIGAGTGMLALAAATMGAHSVGIDIDPFSLALLDGAAKAQNVPVTTQIFDLCADVPLPEADLFVATDVCYEKPLAAALAKHTAHALKRGSAVWIADPGRLFWPIFIQEIAAYVPTLALHAQQTHLEMPDPAVVGGPLVPVVVWQAGPARNIHGPQ